VPKTPKTNTVQPARIEFSAEDGDISLRITIPDSKEEWPDFAFIINHLFSDIGQDLIWKSLEESKSKKVKEFLEFVADFIEDDDEDTEEFEHDHDFKNDDDEDYEPPINENGVINPLNVMGRLGHIHSDDFDDDLI
jgi:hypothetical protein